MKQNRLYTLLQSHRKIGITLFWVIAIFFGCFCFPFVNITKVLAQPKYKISSADLGKLQQFMTDKTEKLPPLKSPYARYIVYGGLLGVIVVFIFAFAIGFVVKKKRK